MKGQRLENARFIYYYFLAIDFSPSMSVFDQKQQKNNCFQHSIYLPNYTARNVAQCSYAAKRFGQKYNSTTCDAYVYMCVIMFRHTSTYLTNILCRFLWDFFFREQFIFGEWRLIYFLTLYFCSFPMKYCYCSSVKHINDRNDIFDRC